jgi:ABC-type sulfate transport system permease subunit
VRTCVASDRVRSTTRAMRLVSVIMSPPTPLNKITGVIANWITSKNELGTMD